MTDEVGNYHDALNRLYQILHDEDERGLVLTTSAFAEDLLGRLIRAYLVDVKASGELLDGFNAPLGTFSSRTRAAYAMGLVSKEQFTDLEHLRKIRNEFAHKWEGCSYARPDIADRIEKMQPSRISSTDEVVSTPQEKLRTSIACILTELDVLARLIGEKKSRIQPLALHLSLYPPKANWPFR